MFDVLIQTRLVHNHTSDSDSAICFLHCGHMIGWLWDGYEDETARAFERLDGIIRCPQEMKKNRRMRAKGCESIHVVGGLWWFVGWKAGRYGKMTVRRDV